MDRLGGAEKGLVWGERKRGWGGGGRAEVNGSAAMQCTLGDAFKQATNSFLLAFPSSRMANGVSRDLATTYQPHIWP